MNPTKTPSPQPPPKLALSTAILAALFGFITLAGLGVALWVQDHPLEGPTQASTPSGLNPGAPPPAAAPQEAPAPASAVAPKGPEPALTPALKPAPKAAPKALAKAAPHEEHLAPVPVKKVTPPYPPLAKAAKVQGEVSVVLKVNDRGVPVEATVLEGPTLLRASALEAAKDWRFRPAYRGSVPVASEFVATFQFHI